jgi:hypothetical protein
MKSVIFLIFLIFALSNNIQANTLSEARRLIQLQKQELTSAKKENDQLKNSLKNAELKIKNGEVHLQEVQFAADSLKRWGIEQQKESFKNFNAMMDEKKEKEKQIELKEKAIKKYHISKFINGVIASILGLVLGLYLMKFVPPTHTHYAFALPLLGIITGFCLIWFLL